MDGMNEMDDLRTRLEAVEAELDRLREDAAATRTLAALADRDAAEVRTSLRAHTQLLSALRETQREQGEAIGQLAQGQAALQRTVQAVAEVVGSLAAGQAALQQGQATLEQGQAELLAEIRRLRDGR